MADELLTNTSLFDGDNVKNTTSPANVTVLSDAGDDILKVTADASAARLRTGKTLTYTITIENTSTTNITASNIKFTDTYDKNYYTVSSAVGGDGAALTLSLNTATAGTITSALFNLAPSQKVTITITGTVTYVAA